jgi:hypothetical protein
MRTLVIGVPLPHVTFDNDSVISVPSLAAFPEAAGVFLRSQGGLAVGVELRVGEGSIVIVPPMAATAEERVLLAETLFQCLERWHNRLAPQAPEWIRKESL